MTPEQLKAIRERATELEAELDACDFWSSTAGAVLERDMPALLAEVERLRKGLEAQKILGHSVLCASHGPQRGGDGYDDLCDCGVTSRNKGIDAILKGEA